VRDSSPVSTDQAAARELWAVSETLVAPWAAPIARAACAATGRAPDAA
jgi:hypothetical protein